MLIRISVDHRTRVETFITKKEHLEYSSYAPQYNINQGRLFTRCQNKVSLSWQQQIKRNHDFNHLISVELVLQRAVVT